MATDVEESDTDDHEKPAPPKRLCTRLVINDTYPKTDERMIEKEEPISEPEIIEFDEAEKYAREKLKRWQDCQFAKGFVDNTINRVLENYIMAPSSYSFEDSRFCAFRGDEMEDTAVMMAIRNHGLVQSAEFVSPSHAFPNNEISNYWNAEELDSTVSCYSSSNQDNKSLSDLGATTSTTSSRSIDMRGIGRYDDINWESDKHNDTDNQEDFMERAVAEAIKKKGLSALSVDYG